MALVYMGNDQKILGDQTYSDLMHRFGEVLEVILSISHHTDVVKIAQQANRAISRFFNVNTCAISRWDSDKGEIWLWAEILGEGQPLEPSWKLPYRVEDDPITKQVLEEAVPAQVRVDDEGADQQGINLLNKFNAKSLLIVPLIAEDNVIGLIEVIDEHRCRTFSPEEVALIQLLGNHIGASIERAQIINESETRVAELEAVRRTSLSLTSSLDLEEVLGVVLESSLDLFEDAEGAHIFLYENQRIRFGAVLWADQRHTLPWSEPREDGLTYAVARSGEKRVVENMQKHPLYETAPKDWSGAIIGFPLKIGERVVGVMNISFQKPRQFSDNSMRVLQMLADHAAAAIERAGAMNEIQQRAIELETLHQASMRMTATLDLDEVLHSVLNTALNLSENALDAHIFLFENEKLEFAAAIWGDGRQKEPWSEPRENGLTYEVARSGKMGAVPDLSDHELFADNPWQGSIVGFPLKSKEKVVGVMNVAYAHPQQFSTTLLQVLGLLADQAALSIENAKLHQLVSEQASTDPLTDIENRRAFSQRLEEEILRARRYNRGFTVALLDLDGFKKVNDTFGHLEGDKTLRTVANLIKNSARCSDLLARWGGDEFVLLLPETNMTNAQKLIKALREKVAQHEFDWIEKDARLKGLTFSAGLASYPDQGEDAKSLLRAADLELYKNKHAKK